MAKKPSKTAAPAQQANSPATVSAPVENIAPPVPAAPAPVTPPWASQPAASPAPAPAAPSPPVDIRRTALARILAETDSGQGYGHIASVEAWLASEGLVEVNEDAAFRNAAGDVAAILTEKGKAYLASAPSAPAWGTRPTAPAAFTPPPTGVVAAPTSAPASAPAPAARKPVENRTFEIDTGIPIPEPKRGGGGLIPRAEIYPFSKLEVGQSFHIPATPDNPNPGKAIGGTVNAANLRYSEEVEGQFRTNRKGNNVPVTRALRHFAARTVSAADNDPRGPGVRVFRLS